MAVAGATDAARGAADIVLTQPGLSTITSAIIGARKIFQRMATYAKYTVAMTFRICFTFGLLTVIYNWCACPALPSLGRSPVSPLCAQRCSVHSLVDRRRKTLHAACRLREQSACRYFPTLLIVLLAVFNDGAMIALSTDRVREAPVPCRWVLGTIFLEGTCPCICCREHTCRACDMQQCRLSGALCSCCSCARCCSACYFLPVPMSLCRSRTCILNERQYRRVRCARGQKGRTWWKQ